MTPSDHGIVLDEKAQEQPKDKKRAQQPSSNDMKGPAPQEDKERDLVHGDGGTIRIPTKRTDISKDD